MAGAFSFGQSKDLIPRSDTAFAQTRPVPYQTQPDQPLGPGLASGAAQIQKLYPLWQQQFMDGETDLQFQEWLKSQGVANPVMPR